MIVVTGAEGEVGQALLKSLGEEGKKAISVFKKGEHEKLKEKTVGSMLFSNLPLWLSGTYEAPWIDKNVEGIVNIGGANSEYSKGLWAWCVEKGKSFVAVDAPVEFEEWAVSQEKKPPSWAILKPTGTEEVVGNICRILAGGQQ